MMKITLQDLVPSLQSIQAVDHQHHVRSFGRRRRAPGSHRDPDVGRRERRRVVEPVPHHDDDAVLALGLDGLDLLVGGAFGQDPVDPEGSPDRLRHVRMIPGDHHDALDARSSERADHSRRIRSDRVVDHEGAGHLPVHADEHG